VGVDGGGARAIVSEQDLDGPRVGAGLEQVGGETVSQRVDCDVLLEAGGPPGLATGLHHSLRGDWPIGVASGEQPGLGARHLPVGPEQLGREHDVAILVWEGRSCEAPPYPDQRGVVQVGLPQYLLPDSVDS
jgi:hypothetical protein